MYNLSELRYHTCNYWDFRKLSLCSATCAATPAASLLHSMKINDNTRTGDYLLAGVAGVTFATIHKITMHGLLTL